MSDRPRGVPAAPSEAQIEAKLLAAARSPDEPDKWVLEIEILAAKAVTGPAFARVGKIARAFVRTPAIDLADLPVIRAEARYVGDERGGAFHLHDVARLEAPD